MKINIIYNNINIVNAMHVFFEHTSCFQINEMGGIKKMFDRKRRVRYTRTGNQFMEIGLSRRLSAY